MKDLTQVELNEIESVQSAIKATRLDIDLVVSHEAKNVHRARLYRLYERLATLTKGVKTSNA